MAFEFPNKTYAHISTTSADWATAVTLETVATGANLHVATVTIVDSGGNGGEVRIIADNGTTPYYLSAVTIEGNDSVDLSPLRPYELSAGWLLKVQTKGGSGLHIVVTGILQYYSA